MLTVLEVPVAYARRQRSVRRARRLLLVIVYLQEILIFVEHDRQAIRLKNQLPSTKAIRFVSYYLFQCKCYRWTVTSTCYPPIAIQCSTFSISASQPNKKYTPGRELAQLMYSWLGISDTLSTVGNGDAGLSCLPATSS